MSSYTAALSSTLVACTTYLPNMHAFAAFSAILMRRMQGLHSRSFTGCVLAESNNRNAYTRRRHTTALFRGLRSLGLSPLSSCVESSRCKRVERFQSSMPNLSSSLRWALTAGEFWSGSCRICASRSESSAESWRALQRDVRSEAKTRWCLR